MDEALYLARRRFRCLQDFSQKTMVIGGGITTFTYLDPLTHRVVIEIRHRASDVSCDQAVEWVVLEFGL